MADFLLRFYEAWPLANKPRQPAVPNLRLWRARARSWTRHRRAFQGPLLLGLSPHWCFRLRAILVVSWACPVWKMWKIFDMVSVFVILMCVFVCLVSLRVFFLVDLKVEVICGCLMVFSLIGFVFIMLFRSIYYRMLMKCVGWP